MRLDHLQRPELNKGTVDFLVPDEYWAIEPPNPNPSYASVGLLNKRQHRPPQPMNYVFAFDISVDAVRSGFLRSSCDALRTTLYQETEEGVVCKLPAGGKIAIISYDCVINVYKLVGIPSIHDTYIVNDSLSQNGSGIADVLVMPDIEDVFLPLGPEIFVDPVEARYGDQHRREDVLIGLHRSVIQDTLTTIPKRADDTTVRESVLGSAICGALAALVRATFFMFGFWRSSC